MVKEKDYGKNCDEPQVIAFDVNRDFLYYLPIYLLGSAKEAALANEIKKVLINLPMQSAGGATTLFVLSVTYNIERAV